MEGLGVFLLIVVVIFVGGWILETVTDGIVAGVFALVALPFRAFKKKQERDKFDSYVNGLYFDTAAPADRLHAALSAHFRAGDFNPMNRVVVLADEPGRYSVGFGWAEGVKFTMEDGSEARGSGEPVVVAELTYQPAGGRIVGRMRLTRFPAHRDWTDEGLMENVLPWCFMPISALDPSAQLHRQPPQSAMVSQPQGAPSLGFASAATNPADPAASSPGHRFNAPPGWQVPAGWSPPAGWRPDPAWPPAPPGWQYWI